MHKERPILSNLINTGTTEVETFQNEILRPIIKMQHNLLIAFFENYLVKRKIDFMVLTDQKKRSKIKGILEKDIQFKNRIVGSILGHFSVDEYVIYLNNSSEFNRRIRQIITKRLQDSITAIKI
jgi:hypothetical protein